MCAHCQVRMCKVIERMHVGANLRECMFVGGVSRPSPLGKSRVEHGSSSVQLSDVYPVLQRRRGLSSLPDHRHIFR